MKPLAGHRVAVLGSMKDRALARYFHSIGAELVSDTQGASFVIDDLGRDAAQEYGIPDNAIHVSVTPFGSDGPRANWRGSELVASAMGGALRVTGEPGLPPVKEAGDACTFHADMVAAAGALAAHRARGRHGKGQHVDVSIQQVAFSRNINGVLVWQFDQRKLHRVGGALAYGKATVRAIWKLADGWCFHSLMTGRLGAPANQGLSDWMDEAGVENPLRGTDWLSYNRSTLPADTRARWEEAIAGFFATRSKQEIRTEGRRRGINACVVNEPADVLADEHLAARGFFDTPSGLPDRFCIMNKGNQSIVSHDAASAVRSERKGPLAGLKVLDFAWALVGSITTKTLGDLGADVVKIESHTRPDLSRLDVQVKVSEAGNLDDKPWFAHLNSSKRSLTLNLKDERSREVLKPLIEWADVVVENFSPGTMAKLGLDFASLQEINPRILMVSGSVYGQTGPLAHEWGVDGTGGALSGRTFMTGYPNRNPVIPGAVPYGDVIVPYVMAAGLCAALQHRDETGETCHIDAAMYEICVQQMRPYIEAATNGDHPVRQGNSNPAYAMQGVFPAKGDDRFVAITCFDEADLVKLRSITGEDISAWIAAREDHAVAEELQQAGIAAGAVQDAEDLIEKDPQIALQEGLVMLGHPLLGPFGHIATPLHFSQDTFVPYRAPRIGEHYAEIARDIAGLDAETIERFQQEGVFK